MHAENTDVADKDIIRKYNHNFAGPIGKGLRPKATVASLRQARGYRLRVRKNTKPPSSNTAENPIK